MLPTIESLGLGSLPTSDRLRLADELYESVARDQPVIPISDELKAELERRVAEDDAFPDDVISFEAFDLEMRRLYPQ